MSAENDEVAIRKAKAIKARDERLARDNVLLTRIKEMLPTLLLVANKVDSEWSLHDHVYRYYHQSFKVFYAQTTTLKIVETLQSVMPDKPLNKQFMEIVAAGTGKEFKMEDNDNWHPATGPILEALFHAKYFLDMLIISGRTLDQSVQMLPIHWASTLYLFNMR